MQNTIKNILALTILIITVSFLNRFPLYKAEMQIKFIAVITPQILSI